MRNFTKRLVINWKLIFCILLGIFLLSQRASAQTVTLTTEPLAASNVLQGKSNEVFYILKVEVTTAPVALNRIRVNTTGTYVAGDLTNFSLYRNATTSETGGTLVSNDNSITGNGETIDFTFGNLTLAAGSVTYFLFRANVSSSATAGNTFRINGSANALTIGYTTAPALAGDNQTDVANARTIYRPSVTYSTEAVAAANILQGSNNQVFYILKVDVGADAGVTINRLRINTTGTYSASDISNFSLVRNATASTSGGTLVSNDNGVSGNGETIDFTFGSLTLAAGSTTYFMIRANVTPGALTGNTYKINGAASSLIVSTLNTTPAVTNSQTDAAGIQTIYRPALTFSTETVAAANIVQGADNQVFYILKLVVGAAAGATINRIRMNTTGTYAATDISNFSLLRNANPNTSGATLVSNDNGISGNGETIDFTFGNLNLAAGSTTYFIVRANVTSAATAGNTFKIDGTANTLLVGVVNTTPELNNNQTDAAGAQTIFRPGITYSTETVAGSNVVQGTNNAAFYILKLEVSSAASVTVNRVRINTTGTYAAADISNFSLLRNVNANTSGATLVSNDNGISGNGETIDFTFGNLTLGASSTTYFIIRANVTAGATSGRTFKIDGSNNALILSFVDTSPQVTNSQSDLAGEKLIGSPSLTYTTEPLAAANVLQGTNNHVFYILKMQNGALPVTINRVRINTAGNYATFDISNFSLMINTTATAAGATLISNDNGVSGAGETIDFTFGNRVLAANTAYYLIIRANVSPSSAAGDNFKINGAASSTIVSYVSTTPAVTNSQTDNAGLQTIFGPQVTYSTEPIAAASVVQGTANHPFYILKVVIGSEAAATFSNVNAIVQGTYTSGNITSFRLYRNTQPSVTGAELLATDNSSTGNGETVSFSFANRTLAAGSTSYLIIRATLAENATINNTFFINGQTGPATLSFFGSSPSTTNNQSDGAGTQTVASSLPVHLVSFDVKTEGISRRLQWKTAMEENNDYFEIQRSLNGRSFSPIGRVDGTGTTNYTHTYYFSDEESLPNAENVYYRLKQVDFDGKSDFSRIVSTRLKEALPDIAVFPNPFVKTLKIRYLPGETVRVELYKMDGVLIRGEKSTLVPVNGEVTLENMDKLPGGSYLIQIHSGSRTDVRKVVRE